MRRDQSCEGWITHHRRVPVDHAFRYRVWMLLVDVDGLADLANVSRWLSVDAPGVLQIRTRDHLPGAEGNLRERVAGTVVGAGQPPPEGPITLLTQPRNLGVSFNPVSFFFCHDAGGSVVESIVAEINNTPWNERHSYVLRSQEPAARVSFEFPKSFHVSPFNDMDVDYRWQFEIGERIHVRMVIERDGLEIFRAGLHLRSQPLDAAAITRGVRGYPAQNLVTLGRIYHQAFQLWRKRTPFHEHPDNREQQHEKHSFPRTV